MLPTALVLALLGLSVGASLHCAVRREISPCTCYHQEITSGAINIDCERMTTYDQVVTALKDRFSPDTKIKLLISHSALPDLPARSFRELGLSIISLKLNFDNISEFHDDTFSKLDLVDYLSISDNSLLEMPQNVLRNVPNVKTLDFGRNKIKSLHAKDFQNIQQIEHFIVPANLISNIERDAFPRRLKHIHLGKNNLSNLNGTLRNLDYLEWIFINRNNLRTIENEISMKATKMSFISASHNNIEYLPKDLRSHTYLDELYFDHNNITSLNGAMQKLKRLKTVNLSFNQLESLAHDDFAESDILFKLDIGHNKLKALNGALRWLRSLQFLNLTHNDFPEFSLQEIKGMKLLSIVDLSHNKISHLTGNMENLVELETKVLELRLDHNLLHNLGGALTGLHGLVRLNLSYNLMEEISPDDLISLDELFALDVSHNQITTLEETSKTFLPALTELLASHNNITMLDKDFHGLPSLCVADLSYNDIRSINYELVTKTRCTLFSVPSKLKLNIQDNPILCDEKSQELMAEMEKLNTRLQGTANCPTNNAATPLLPIRTVNDMSSKLLKPSILITHNSNQQINIIPLEKQRGSGQAFAHVSSIVGQILPARDGGLPIIVDPPITLPTITSTPPPKLVRMIDMSKKENRIDVSQSIEPEPVTVPGSSPP